MLIYRLLSLCSITVAALGALAGRCSVTVLLPLSKWLFFGLLPLWWPISLKWCPKWVSRVIFECNSLSVSPPRFSVLTFTDALIGFMAGLTEANGTIASVVPVEQKDRTTNFEKIPPDFSPTNLADETTDIIETLRTMILWVGLRRSEDIQCQMYANMEVF